MTREEAIEDLITLKRRGITEHMDTSIDTAIAALRGSVPDPETGLVRCGCGGKPVLLIGLGSPALDEPYSVFCPECAFEGKSYPSEEDASIKWNTAMGAEKV